MRSFFFTPPSYFNHCSKTAGDFACRFACEKASPDAKGGSTAQAVSEGFGIPAKATPPCILSMLFFIPSLVKKVNQERIKNNAKGSPVQGELARAGV